MKFAVYGLGSIGRRHIGNLLALGVAAEDIATYDPSATATARARQEYPGITGSLTDISSCDAALVCSPVSEHAGALCWITHARRPFFVEKPAVTAISNLPEAVWKTGLPHLVGYNLRFQEQAKRLIKAKPRSGTLLCVLDMATWPGQSYADPLREISHELDLACALGAERLVFAHNAGRTWTLMLETSTGGCRGVVVSGEVWDQARPYVRSWTDSGGTSYGSFSAGAELGDEMYLDEMRHFLKVVRGGTASRCTLRDARKVLTFCEQAEAYVAEARLTVNRVPQEVA